MNQFVRLFVTVSFIQFVFSPLNAKAWDAIGHMLVTNVAAEHLTPLAREKIYGTLPFDPTHKNTSLSAEYVRSSQELARQQIVLAGLRLANLLNQLLDPEHAAPVTSAQPNS
jgi:hypothetical protein